MPISSDDLLTTAEVAQILNKPVGTVNRWAKQGYLRSIKLPTRTGSRLYRRSDVDAFSPPKRGGDRTGKRDALMAGDAA